MHFNEKKAIVIVAKDIEETLLNYYTFNIGENADIFLLSPSFDEALQKKFKTIHFIQDCDFLDRTQYSKLEQTSRPNWYYQQFLKYNVVIQLYKTYNYKLIHIIDGDSYVNPDIFFKEKIYYTPKRIEVQYQEFIDKTNVKGRESKNFISNQMCFNPLYLNEMLNFISAEINWIDFFLDILLSNKNLWFSEYQLYACFVKINYGIKEEPLKVFRRIDLIDTSVDKALKKYSIVAFEKGHKNDHLRTIRASIYYFLGKNLG